MPGYAEQIDLIVAVLCGFHVPEEPTPIYDDMVAAREAGFTGTYHPHWRLELSWAEDAYWDLENNPPF